MTHGRLALIAGLFLLASSGPGMAGGLVDTAPAPEAVAPNWGGFYVGGQLGGAWADADWDYRNANWFNTIGPEQVIDTFSIDGSGFVGGGQLGFNYQTGAFVLGVEGSILGSDVDGNTRSPAFPQSDRYTMEIGWMATATGRIGYAFGPLLAYGKGGWAGADVELDLFDRGTPVRARSSNWADGYTLGGGAEYALTGGLSLGVEYAFIDVETGRVTMPCGTCPSGVGGGAPSVDGDIEIQSVVARLNYRFGQ